MAAPYTTIRSRAPPPTATTMMLMIHIYSYARARAGLLTSLRGAETPWLGPILGPFRYQ